jgi:hypothetical protein
MRLNDVPQRSIVGGRQPHLTDEGKSRCSPLFAILKSCPPFFVDNLMGQESALTIEFPGRQSRLIGFRRPDIWPGGDSRERAPYSLFYTLPQP